MIFAAFTAEITCFDIFFALSQAPPELAIITASAKPDIKAPASIPTTPLHPSTNPTIIGASIPKCGGENHLFQRRFCAYVNARFIISLCFSVNQSFYLLKLTSYFNNNFCAARPTALIVIALNKTAALPLKISL